MPRLPDHLPILGRPGARLVREPVYVEREIIAPGVATGWAGEQLLGVSFGAKWTTGTGSNENGSLCDGRLHKLMEDVRCEYDPVEWRKPWRLVAPHSRALDLVLEPVVAHTPRSNLGVLATGGVCAFGRWRGTVRVEGRELPVDGLVGWAEELAHRWRARLSAAAAEARGRRA